MSQYVEPDQILYCVNCDHYWHPLYAWGESGAGSTCPACGSRDLGGYPPDLSCPEDVQRLIRLRQRWEQSQ